MQHDTDTFELHLDVTDDGKNAVELLASQCTLSKQAIKQAMRNGAAWLTHGKHTRRLRRAGKLMHTGDQLHLYYNKKVLTEIPPLPRLVQDEGDYSVWYKPYGLRSQGSKWGDHCTINRQVEQLLKPQRPAFIVHRLDRAATGLILIAHSKKMAAALADKFKQRQISKHYRVKVHGQFQTQPITVDQALDDKPAISHIHLLEVHKEENTSLLEVSIETGRKHQVRRHLAGLGYPVVGDRLYGNSLETDDLALECVLLAFQSPDDNSQKTYQIHT